MEKRVSTSPKGKLVQHMPRMARIHMDSLAQHDDAFISGVGLYDGSIWLSEPPISHLF